MKVVVTGGAGFIGSNTCRALVHDPLIEEVVAVDDLSTGNLANLEGVGVELVQGTILDPATLDGALVGANAIVHLAARPSVSRSLIDPFASHHVNASGTVQVLEAARRAGNPRVVVASSSSVYGANPTMPKHEDLAPMPCSPYAASKLATEAYSLAYARSFGIGVLALRFFNVFGPRQPAGHAYAAVIPAFVDAALAGRALSVHGDGKQSRDFTFVDTVTAVLCEAVTRRMTAGTPINLAFGTKTDLLTVISLLESILGRRLRVEQREPRTGDVRDSQADRTRLIEMFPNVTPVDLETGLRRTVEWFRSQRGGD